MRNRRGQRGMALMSVLIVILVLVLVGSLVLYLTGKEIAFVGMRLSGAQSLNIAEGGAVAARSAMMALFNADPIRTATTPAGPGEAGPPVSASLTNGMLDGWYTAQDSFSVLGSLTLDGQSISVSPSGGAVELDVNWALPTPRLKLQAASGTPPANPLGAGTYRARIRLTGRQAPHPFDPGQPQRYVQRLGGAYYEFYYDYLIASDGGVSPQFRRRVELRGQFSIRIRRQSFAEYALFTHQHLTPNTQPTASCSTPPCTPGPIWFTSDVSFDGPVHTNGQFRFAFFPKFGTPPPLGPGCDQNNGVAAPLTSVSTTAWFNNNGNPVERALNEWVVGGARRDAPVRPDCTPGNTADDNTNLPANFTRGVAAVPMPSNIYSQQGVAIGRDPANDTPVTNSQIRQVVPELANNGDPIPNGIYIPVQDANGNGISDDGELLAGGIYVQGNLTNLTMSLGGPSNNLAVYTLVQGTQTVTVTVDRALNRTTVTNSAWPSPQTRTFNSVPKGWQVNDPDLANATIIYVEGNILGLGGTLEEKEQTTIVANGRIDITNHIRYEAPPNPNDINSNPTNLLGIYSAINDIRITMAAPNNLDIHAVLMAGSMANTYHSSVQVENYRTRPPSGSVNLIGGIIEKYYGAFFTFSTSTGTLLSGYNRNFVYDRRMSRGFTPPYFPSTNAFDLIAHGLAGTRPVWREAAP